ncbi:hypothetical protein OS493_030226 [Desmophyllum pertusum]|uniref:Gag-pol polyprotein n=1 Tax=Desmophyllum pertusum TaxID=174260 RepID=A0A9X0CD68_9CNID|nr:hypothetical protein OS493_030226 [Desmophyllum pertusum]
MPRPTMFSSDDEYTFTLDSPTKVSAPFVSLKVNGVMCKFSVDSGASVSIVSHDVSKMFDIRIEPCDTRVYAFNSSMLGYYSACCWTHSLGISFKKLLSESDKPVTPLSDSLEEDTTDVNTQSNSSSYIPASVQEHTNSPLYVILTEPVPRRSTRVSVPPKRLIQET